MLLVRSIFLMWVLQLSESDVCYPGMSCFKDHFVQASPEVLHTSDDSTSNLPGQSKANGPNYMIPVWKERLYDAANNESYKELIAVLNEGGPHSVLIAYQGCKIVNVLSHHKREERGEEIREALAGAGAVAAVTRSMGAHLPFPKVQAMGCAAIQALADGHADNTAAAVATGGSEVVAWVLARLGPADRPVAEFCTAAVATLAVSPAGRARLGRAGAAEAVLATMAAHVGAEKPDIQVYGCACLQRLSTDNGDNARRIVENPASVAVVVEALRRHGHHPVTAATCGALLSAGDPAAARSLPPAA